MESDRDGWKNQSSFSIFNDNFLLYYGKKRSFLQSYFAFQSHTLLLSCYDSAMHYRNGPHSSADRQKRFQRLQRIVWFLTAWKSRRSLWTQLRKPWTGTPADPLFTITLTSVMLGIMSALILYREYFRTISTRTSLSRSESLISTTRSSIHPTKQRSTGKRSVKCMKSLISKIWLR